LIKKIETLACLSVMAAVVGCAEQAPAVDEAPFRRALVEYLQNNDMALAIKEIKAGPTIDGRTAQLSASLTHAQLGGPSVTWEFQFGKQPDGTWLVTGHKD